MNKINRKTFFADIKPLFKGGYAGKVGEGRISGLDLLIDTAEKENVGYDEFAYILATTLWETAYTVQPIAEYGKGKGRKYGVKGKYGQVPYGRGYVQLTWDYNYEKADKELGLDGALLKNFDLALDPKVAVLILFKGMQEGWFTGKKLKSYIDGVQEPDAEDLREYEEGRRIINGVDKKKEIAKLALTIDRALRKAEVANPYPLASSRTVQGAATVATVSTVNLVNEVNGVVTAVEAHQSGLTSGSIIPIAISLIAICGALYTLYARWDDAGRPKFWKGK
jgi:hypothetical protein